MGILTTVLGFVTSLLITFIYLWIRHKYNYWNRRGIKGPKPLPFFGNIKDVVITKKDVNSILKEHYDQFPKEPAIGIFAGFRPVLVVRDLEFIKQIMVKDFNAFLNRGLKSSDNPIVGNLFQAEDETWRTLRSLLNPSFTSKKLKQWSPRLQKCLNDYTKFVEGLVENQTDHEIKSLVSTYNFAVTGACLFSIDLDPFSGKCEAFMNIIGKIMKPSFMDLVRYFIYWLCPAFDYFIQTYLKMKPNSYDAINVIKQFTKRAVVERKNNPHPGNDFVDLIMKIKDERQAKKHDKDSIKICDNVLLAQSIFYTVASYDASAPIVTFMLHELAFNQNIQDRVHREIKQITEKYKGIISTYEALDEMTYLQMVFDEALRKYPISPIIRHSSEDYVFSGTNIKIEKNTRILIPLSGLQADPAYFENPELFEPERFSPENKSKIPQFAFLPFGEGPRHCIGMRFVKLQALAGLAALLGKYKVEPSEKTERHLKFHPMTLNAQPLSEVWLKITRRT